MPRNLKLSNAPDGKHVTFTWGADGNPVFDDNEAECVLSLLMERPWFSDPAGKRQSKIMDVKSVDASTPGLLETRARDALQPAIDDKRLKSVSPVAIPSGLGYELRVGYVTGRGVRGEVSVPLSA